MDDCTPAQITELGLYLISFARFSSESGPAEDQATYQLTSAIIELSGGENSDVPTPFRELTGDNEGFMDDEIPLEKVES
jgi:hypothetical protein